MKLEFDKRILRPRSLMLAHTKIKKESPNEALQMINNIKKKIQEDKMIKLNKAYKMEKLHVKNSILNEEVLTKNTEFSSNLVESKKDLEKISIDYRNKLIALSSSYNEENECWKNYGSERLESEEVQKRKNWDKSIKI